MPRCGATFDENTVPPWTRGDFRGVLGEPPLKAVFMPPGGASTIPAVPLASAYPPRRRGRFSRS